MGMERESRIEAAWRRVLYAKRSAVALAVGALALTVGLARSSHPGHAASTPSTASSEDDSSASDDGGFGSGSFGQAQSAPSVSTGQS
jgi:hypothetical protein